MFTFTAWLGCKLGGALSKARKIEVTQPSQAVKVNIVISFLQPAHAVTQNSPRAFTAWQAVRKDTVCFYSLPGCKSVHAWFLQPVRL